jgi:hypothetical protein
MARRKIRRFAACVAPVSRAGRCLDLDARM